MMSKTHQQQPPQVAKLCIPQYYKNDRNLNGIVKQFKERFDVTIVDADHQCQMNEQVLSITKVGAVENAVLEAELNTLRKKNFIILPTSWFKDSYANCKLMDIPTANSNVPTANSNDDDDDDCPDDDDDSTDPNYNARKRKRKSKGTKHVPKVFYI